MQSPAFSPENRSNALESPGELPRALRSGNGMATPTLAPALATRVWSLHRVVSLPLVRLLRDLVLGRSPALIFRSLKRGRTGRRSFDPIRMEEAGERPQAIDDSRTRLVDEVS